MLSQVRLKLACVGLEEPSHALRFHEKCAWVLFMMRSEPTPNDDSRKADHDG